MFMVIRNKKILGIIPARGGSKGIPGKNIKDFYGQPLIYWTIEPALKSGVLSRLIVSTDDDQIAKVAKSFGAEVPFKRPAELADDKSPTLLTVIHAVKYLRENANYSPDFIFLLEPTFPGRQPQQIKEAVDLILKTKADSVISLVEVPGKYNPAWQFEVDNDGRTKIATGATFKEIVTRRQDLPKTYIRNGAVYLFKTGLLFENKPSFYGKDVRAYIMNSDYDLDIDTAEDWRSAESKMALILK